MYSFFFSFLRATTASSQQWEGTRCWEPNNDGNSLWSSGWADHFLHVHLPAKWHSVVWHTDCMSWILATILGYLHHIHHVSFTGLLSHILALCEFHSPDCWCIEASLCVSVCAQMDVGVCRLESQHQWQTLLIQALGEALIEAPSGNKSPARET